jgi:hypothetical protein
MPDWRSIVAGLLASGVFPAASQDARLPQTVRTIVPFQTSPFPYHGTLPDGSGPFLDVTSNGRRGHTPPRGGVHWKAKPIPTAAPCWLFQGISFPPDPL